MLQGNKSWDTLEDSVYKTYSGSLLKTIKIIFCEL